MTHEKGPEIRRRHPVLAVVLALSILGLAPVLAPLSAAPGSGTCAPAGSTVTKVDSPSDPFTFTAPEGQQVDAIYIKAGQECIGPISNDHGGPGACYSVVFSEDRRTVIVDRIGSGSTCKGVSHIEFVISGTPEEPTTTTTTTTTSTSTTTTTTTTTAPPKEPTTTTTTTPTTTTTTAPPKESTTTTTIPKTTTTKCFLNLGKLICL